MLRKRAILTLCELIRLNSKGFPVARKAFEEYIKLANSLFVQGLSGYIAKVGMISNPYFSCQFFNIADQDTVPVEIDQV